MEWFYYISLQILRDYVYFFCQIFQRLRLFKGLRLFQTLEYHNLSTHIFLQVKVEKFSGNSIVTGVTTAMSRKQSGSTQEFHFCFSTMSTHIFLLVTLFLVFCTNNWLLFPVSRQLQFSQWGQNFYKVPFEFVYTNRSQKNFSYFIRRQEKKAKLLQAYNSWS